MPSSKFILTRLHPLHWVILFCLLAGLFFAGKWGIASASHSLAMNHLEQWQKDGERPDKQMWLRVEQAMLFSLVLDADNADYYNNIGRLYEHVSIYFVEGVARRETLLKSVASFRKATELRPSWALAWANFTLLKHRAKQIDDELELSMSRALELGRATAYTQLIIAEVGLANWTKLSTKTQGLVLENIHQALNNTLHRKVMDKVIFYNMKPYVCSLLPLPDQQKFCKNIKR